MKKSTLLILSLLTVFIAPLSTVQAEGLLGKTVLVTNKFKGKSTKNIEVDVSSFGLKNNLFAKVGNNLELPGFITLYDINISNDSISFNWIESKFSKKVGGPMPDDKHDRNYFVFDLPGNMEIKSVEFDKKASSLIKGSALPTVKLISRNKFMTEFAKGVIRVKGFKPVFKVTTGPAKS